MQNSGRFEALFGQLKAQGRSGLYPFVTAGDPDLAFTRRLLPALAEAGADGFEIGVPFSDPLADGPTIQRASMRSLKGGTTLKSVIELVADVRAEMPDAPIVLMTYYNPIIAYGLKAFCSEAARAGADAVIVPDLPPEEAGELLDEMSEVPLEPIFMLAPTSTDARIDLVNRSGGGFIYYVAQMGVTGARDSLATDMGDTLERINRVKNRPVAVGFGIKTPEQAAEAGAIGDGVIVGSALIDVMEREEGDEEKLQAACRYIESLRRALEGSKAAS
ncbi:MAG: tryptophan synthase subunit alpha [Nitrospinaceae bacterium]|jgi:tryptophan synthase alpha chain|nr:tryptophan synthase subunit alpha [Nitrospinaceae bacterium]MBT3432723.1 tryptophan synthase subunit alpha [Nitrospinaceae bacterium]MBT3823018.1 tryptophan synthase subunit alpha [Nitrospinaceae bacterium]MBT4093549.1 tryptophan synthase subunit alpha [Nitrospinaceae bacterium]MBT4431209.1 tryptophan synthase subunit alpha [Nitrospinaceae bacterium]